jgi:periplasmic divalent cation tolerance protein
MAIDAIVVLITVPTVETGRSIAAMLLQEKLAACVNIVPGVSSLFTWQGQASEEQEALLIVKTRSELFEQRLIPAVKAAHPYEVPEIIALPVVGGSRAYLEWIEQETGGPGPGERPR